MEIIASFWKGQLTRFEYLAIQSWLNAGFVFHLYTYEHVEGIPAGVVICDARDILPAETVDQFRYIANYADCFRYKMIHDTGKIWTDLDVFCLNKPDLSRDTIFVTERTIRVGAFKSKKPEKVVICFIKGQKGSNLFRKLWTECLDLNSRWNARNQSNEGLAADKHPGGRLLVEKHINESDIVQYDFAFPVDWWDFGKCFKELDSWTCSRGWDNIIHVDTLLEHGQLLCIHNGWVKHNNIDKENPVEGSLYDKLCKKVSSHVLN